MVSHEELETIAGYVDKYGFEIVLLAILDNNLSDIKHELHKIIEKIEAGYYE